MSHILLLGAGFSRNWGGLLADEVFDDLIGQSEVAQDEYLKTLLWKHRTAGGFESALEDAQVAFAANPATAALSLQRLQSAIFNTFERMNRAFFNAPTMEFQSHIEIMIRTFLARFDAIFTLNQDVLLEHHYLHQIELTAPNKWRGAQLPGLQRRPSVSVTTNPSWGRDVWIPVEKSSFRIDDGLQPYFKLHGSSNWRDSDGGQLMVLGGNKYSAIRAHPILGWYFEQFRLHLSQPASKLFVIGYGFRDRHVNDVIVESVQNRGLRFFVIDSCGSDVVRRANSSYRGSIYCPTDLDDAFRQGLIGASRRGLSEIFGNDQVAHEQVSSFFTDGV